MNRPLGRQPNQLRAADPATSAWVTANAGTGKTRVLVDRVLRLLLAGTAPSRILCLTFTKAAAAEMANRLAETLGAWSTMADGDLDDHLRALTSKDPDAADRRRARRLFAETLEAPGGLNLRTIHSFCESLLGRFPVEARVAPHFTVIDERTAREWLREARNRVFRRLDRPQATALRQAMDHLAGTTDEDRFDRLMADLNARRGRLARALEATGGLDGAKARVRAALDLPEGLDEATVRDGAIAGADWAALNPAIDLMATSNDTDKKHARLLAGGRDGHLDFEAYKAVFLVKAGRRKNLIAKQLERDYPAIARALAVEQDRVEALAETLKALALARSTEALLTVGQALVAAYADIKGARAGLDYDDLIGAARALLEDDGRVGWVHYKLDGGIDHVLVDEAQDTSPDQWAVIEALVADFTAGEGAREGVERTLFVVGDEKQSIYSFQGADLDTFRARHVRFKRRFGAAGKAWEDVRLETSFRSTRPVLDLVDQVFNQAPEGVVEAGALHHETGRPGLAGLVELWPLLEPVEAPEEDPWDAPLDHTTADSPDRRLAEAVARRVAGWLKAGERLPGAGRPLAAGDVMILVQRRATFYQHMVRALKHHNVPVAGADRMVLTREMAVMDLMALGRFLLFPDDDLSLAGVLKSPLIGLDEDALFELAHGRGKGDHLWPTLRRRAGERADFAAAAERLSAWLGRADREAPYDFLTELLGPGKGRQRFLARLGVDANDAIDEFLGLALLYEREHPPAWQGFLSWVEAGATEVKRDLEQVKDAVRVMTVHGSKGLEAPVVILPDTVRVPDPNKDTSLFWTDPADGGPSVPLWVPSKEDDVVATETLREARNTALRREYRRLLYVAMTRARERVYLGGWRTKKAPAEGNWHDLVSAVLATDDDKIALDDGTEAWRRAESGEAPAAEPTAAAAAAESLPGWANLPPPPEPTPPRPLAPSRPEEDPPVRAPLAPGDDGARFRRGRLIHRLLQSLPDLPVAARDAAARRFLARPALGLDPAEQTLLADETLAVLADPAFADLFGPGSQAEVPLVGTVGGQVLSARVDRLLVTADRVVVVDFKTNRPPPPDAAGVPAVYLRQMATYRLALQGVYPGRAVDCLLLWTDGPRLMPLPAALLDAQRIPGAP